MSLWHMCCAFIKRMPLNYNIRKSSDQLLLVSACNHGHGGHSTTSSFDHSSDGNLMMLSSEDATSAATSHASIARLA